MTTGTRRTRIGWLVALAVGSVLVLSACDGEPSVDDPTTTTTTAPVGPDREVIGTTFADVPTDDPPVSGVVGFAGGALAGSTADGQAYVLVVPEGALADPTEITVQPLERGGPPFGDDALFAFDLQPEGLTFTRPAYLIVNPPGGVPSGLVGIGSFGDDGQAFHREVSTIGRSVVLELRHFSSARATANTTFGEQQAWSQEVARAFTPSDHLTAEGSRYAAAVDAANRAIVGQAVDGVVDEAAIIANFQAWLDDRIEGQLLAVGGRGRLVQAVNEVDRVASSAQRLLTGENLEQVMVEVAATEEAVRQAWLALFSTYLAPDCSAPLLDATDAFQHPRHIAAIAEVHSWDGFALPMTPEGWCARVRVEQLDVPPTVPDEELTTSTDTVPVTMRYAIRTPRPAIAGETLESRFDNGPVRLAERLDTAIACLRVLGASGTIGGENESCEPLDYQADTFTVQVDPTGLADLEVEASVSLEGMAEIIPPATRRATALRQQRTLTLVTPSTVLPSPPHVAQVCAEVTEVTSAGSSPAVGVEVALTLDAGAGSTGTFAAVTEPTGVDGKVCTEYSYDTLPRPAPGSSSVVDQIAAAWTDHLGQARTTYLLLEPDWVDLRLWNTADGRPFTERISSAAPTTHTFATSRFSTWQAALVRRFATPAEPNRSGARAITPDGGPSGTFEDGGGIVVEPGTDLIAVGGHRYQSIGIDLLGEDQPTPAFQVCLCYESGYSAGSATLRFSASHEGVTLSHELAVDWPQLTSPPVEPEPEPEPTPDPDGVTRTVVYAPERVFDPGTYRYDGGIQNVTQRTSDGTLIRQVDIVVDGEAVFCPRIDIIGIFESYCSSFTNSVNDITWTISGGSTVLSFAGEPRSFVLRLTVGTLGTEGWTEQVFEKTIIPGDDPDPAPTGPTDGPGSPGWTDECLEEQGHVHELRDPDDCNCA